MPTAVSATPALTRALEQLRSRGMALSRGNQPEPIAGRKRPAIPTGHAGLDVALGTVGWPRGALALLDAPRGCGGTSLALDTVAAAQAAGALAAWVDLDESLDPVVAQQHGVDLEWLLVVTPRHAAEGIDLATWLGRSGLIDVLVLDLGDRGASDRRALDRLSKLLSRSGSTSVLVLAPAARAVVGSVAGVRVSLHRSAWLAAGREIVGQRVRATVERHRWALAGGSAELDLWFRTGRHIDALLMAEAQPRPIAMAHPALQEVSA